MSAVAYYEPYKLPAGILAAAVHGVFFALLYFGFSWQAQPYGTMSVELWQSLPGETGVPPGQPQVEEAAPPPPEKVVKPEGVQPPQPEKTVEPEIVLPDKKKVETRPVEAKPEERKPEKKKPEKVKPVPRIAEVIAQSAGQGTGGMTGQAARERAERAAAMGRAVDEYTGRIVSKIRSNIVMPPDVADDARAEFLVTLLPGGAVLSAKLVKPSGNAAYDDAVERAILKSQPLPLPVDVTMFNKFRELKLVFKPVE